jgi:GntR family transcriptional regulator
MEVVPVPPPPLYRRIAADLRTSIHRGTLPPGTQLPTEQDLVAKYKVSRTTVRLAISMLANEGLVTSTPGRGTFVRDRATLTYFASRSEKVSRPTSESDAYLSEVTDQGRTATQDFSTRVVPASAAIAERLWIDEGVSTVVRRCFRYVDDDPWSIQDSYYPMELCEGTELMSPNDIPRGTTRVLMELGYPQVAYVDELTTRMPSPEEARGLDLGTGSPVLVFVRTGWTPDRPVRVTETVFAGDRNRVVYELGDLPDIYYEKVADPG